MKRKSLFSFIVLGVFFVFGMILLFSNSVASYESLENFDGSITLYKSSSCGCCGIYSSYFKRNGNSKINVVNVPDTGKIMNDYNIPSFLESCHTVVIGDYFVEGHVPLEAVEKLLSEKPDILGIGMPGMPEGSPGMPGAKRGDFVIYGINKDGSSFEFMRI
jgi:hypothetical protein